MRQQKQDPKSNGWTTEALLALALDILAESPPLYRKYLARLEKEYLKKYSQDDD